MIAYGGGLVGVHSSSRLRHPYGLAASYTQQHLRHALAEHTRQESYLSGPSQMWLLLSSKRKHSDSLMMM